MKNKTKKILLMIMVLGLAGIVYATSLFNLGIIDVASANSYGFSYGTFPVVVDGNLSAAGMNDDEETAVVVKTEHQTVNVTPGVSQTSPIREVMGFNIYNHTKGIVSGDRGYLLVPMPHCYS